jgi:hypothetical protein
MEGTPRLAERGRRPFKPQTVLLRRVPSVGSNDIWRSQTESGSHGFAVSWQLEEKAELEGQTVFQLLLLCLISTMGRDNVRMNTYCDVDYAARPFKSFSMNLSLQSSYFSFKEISAPAGSWKNARTPVPCLCSVSAIPLTFSKISSIFGTRLLIGTAYVSGAPSRLFIGKPTVVVMLAAATSLSLRCFMNDCAHVSSWLL